MENGTILLLALAISVLLGYIIYLRIRYSELKEKHLQHRFHHRFKTLSTKSLKQWLDNKKVKTKEDEIMYNEIEKIVEGRNNRRKK